MSNSIIQRARKLSNPQGSGVFGEYFFFQVESHDSQNQHLVGRKVVGQSAVGDTVRLMLDPKIDIPSRPQWIDLITEGGKPFLARGSVVFVQNATLHQGVYHVRWLNKVSDGMGDVFVFQALSQVLPERVSDAGKPYRIARFVFPKRKVKVSSMEELKDAVRAHLSTQVQKESIPGSGIGLQLLSLADKQAALAVASLGVNGFDQSDVNAMTESLLQQDSVFGVADLIDGDNLWLSREWEVNMIPASVKFFSDWKRKLANGMEKQYCVGDAFFWRDSVAMMKKVKSRNSGKEFFSLQAAAPTSVSALYMPHAWEEDSQNLTYREACDLRKASNNGSSGVSEVPTRAANSAPPGSRGACG